MTPRKAVEVVQEPGAVSRFCPSPGVGGRGEAGDSRVLVNFTTT